MVAIGPKIHGFKPVQSYGFLRAIKIRITLSFGREIKPEDPCHKILWHEKSLARRNKNT
jgi:hypothetical protein